MRFLIKGQNTGTFSVPYVARGDRYPWDTKGQPDFSVPRYAEGTPSNFTWPDLGPISDPRALGPKREPRYTESRLPFSVPRYKEGTPSNFTWPDLGPISVPRELGPKTGPRYTEGQPVQTIQGPIGAPLGTAGKELQNGSRVNKIS